jgi:hypothetical protein
MPLTLKSTSSVLRTYKVNDHMRITRLGILPKFKSPINVPNSVTQVYTIGRVQIFRCILSQRIKIHRINPIFSTGNSWEQLTYSTVL